MKISKILMVMILLGVLVLVSGCDYSTEPIIDELINHKLELQSNIRVNIIVTEGTNITQLIDELSPLEFQLGSFSLNERSVSGKITKKGIQKLKDDNRILKIYIPKLAVTNTKNE